MISLDIETSGLDSGRCGIWQIGAVEVENPSNFFLEEARIDDEDKIEKEALTLTGKTESELRDKSKQPQKQLILNLIKWMKSCKNKIILGHNIGFDVMFLQNKCIRYNITNKFKEASGFKSLDIHTISQIKHLEKEGKFKIKDDGKSDMNLTQVMKFVGLEDKRMRIENNKIIKEGTPHNALEDAKIVAECYRRLMEK